jgi:hypothetical protein
MAVNTYHQDSDGPLPAGEVTVRMRFEADATKPGTGGTMTPWADDVKVGEGRMDHTGGMRFSFYAGVDIGRDKGMIVDPAYRDQAPYAFTGTVKKVVLDLKPERTWTSSVSTRPRTTVRPPPAWPADPEGPIS